MTLATEVKSMYNHTKEVYDSLETLGATMPEDKNLENLVDVFDTLSIGGGYDPANPTLEGLKAAVDAGDYAAFPVGTEIPDTYDGSSNPLIVAQYLDNSNNSSYGGAEGVILVRKYVEPVSQVFGNSQYYPTTTVKTFLDSTYYNNCSNEIKNLISYISIPTTQAGLVSSRWFIMSAKEMCFTYAKNDADGYPWEYWKNKTGLTSPYDGNNSGRVLIDRESTAYAVWTRSPYDSSDMCCNTQYGGIGHAYVTATRGILPACFISKN